MGRMRIMLMKLPRSLSLSLFLHSFLLPPGLSLGPCDEPWTDGRTDGWTL